MDNIFSKETTGGTAAGRKWEMRKELKRRRANLPEKYRKDADRQIFRHVISLSEYQSAETIFCYVGTDGEIDTSPILEHIVSAGKRLGVPRCIEKGVMEVRSVTSLDQLKPGMYGIPEPDEACPLICPGEIDLAFVPCLSCSRDGRRLGYGGGYYDRYLARTGCRRIALCQEKMTEEAIPAEEWDLRMDGVITEHEYIQCNKADGRKEN